MKHGKSKKGSYLNTCVDLVQQVGDQRQDAVIAVSEEHTEDQRGANVVMRVAQMEGHSIDDIIPGWGSCQEQSFIIHWEWVKVSEQRYPLVTSSCRTETPGALGR